MWGCMRGSVCEAPSGYISTSLSATNTRGPPITASAASAAIARPHLRDLSQTARGDQAWHRSRHQPVEDPRTTLGRLQTKAARPDSEALAPLLSGEGAERCRSARAESCFVISVYFSTYLVARDRRPRLPVRPAEHQQVLKHL